LTGSVATSDPGRGTFPDAMLSTLEEGRLAYVAVPSARGPHVTPELYAWSGGRLWFAAASTTVKTRALQRTATAGALVSIAGRAVVLSGTVEAFDARDPGGVARQLRRWPDVIRAMARYTTRNAPDLLAFLGDAGTGKLGVRLPMRVLFALTPSSAAHIENDAVVTGWGEWSPSRAGGSETVPTGGEPAVAAFPGSLVLPVRWFPEQQVLHAPRGLLGLLDVDDVFDVGIVVDDYRAPGPAAKRGTLVRGRARLVGDDPGFVEVEPEVLVHWTGVETAQVAAS
jgi:hypothetical protein